MLRGGCPPSLASSGLSAPKASVFCCDVFGPTTTTAPPATVLASRLRCSSTRPTLPRSGPLSYPVLPPSPPRSPLFDAAPPRSEPSVVQPSSTPSIPHRFLSVGEWRALSKAERDKESKLRREARLPRYEYCARKSVPRVQNWRPRNSFRPRQHHGYTQLMLSVNAEFHVLGGAFAAAASDASSALTLGRVNVLFMPTDLRRSPIRMNISGAPAPNAVFTVIAESCLVCHLGAIIFKEPHMVIRFPDGMTSPIMLANGSYYIFAKLGVDPREVD